MAILLAHALAASVWTWHRLAEPEATIVLAALWTLTLMALMLLLRGGRRLLQRIRRRNPHQIGCE